MNSDPASAAQLIALDWGTSSLRAFLMGARGSVLATRQADAGVQRLAGGGAAAFERAFDEITAGWRDGAQAALPVVACGMVGSAQGWREVPYAATPADAAAIARHATAIDTATGARVLVAPGVLHAPAEGVPDVMRGEETQVFGALLHEPAWARACTVLLPGTHAKWVRVRDGRIEALATYLTGELFAVLRTHSILGRLMTADAAPAEHAPHDAGPSPGFARGLQEARQAVAAGDLLHALFATRTLGLTKQLPPEQLADFLSGLLIGSEVAAALAAQDAHGPASQPLLLVGEPALCRRYAHALAAWQRTPTATLGNTAPQGLWALARAAGVVAG